MKDNFATKSLKKGLNDFTRDHLLWIGEKVIFDLLVTHVTISDFTTEMTTSRKRPNV